MAMDVVSVFRARITSNPIVYTEYFHSHDSDRIVVKDSRDVFRREFICSITYQEAGLAHGTIANDYASKGSISNRPNFHGYFLQSEHETIT